MIWVSLAAQAVNWSAWLWQHRKEFAADFKKFDNEGELTQAALVNPDGTIRRLGNTIVFKQAEGNEEVLAFIEQTGPQLNDIESAVSGVQASQHALSSSLGSLQTLSMVTLGLTALTPVVLGVQFIALNRRLAALQKQIADLHKKFDATVKADLNTGLGLLRQGQDFLEKEDGSLAHIRINAALPFCQRTMKYYGQLLGDTLGQTQANPDEVHILSRHLSVALAGVAGCQIALKQDQHAFSESKGELDLLRSATRHIFHQKVGQDPAQFLMPEMRERGVTLSLLTELFRQARDAGAVDTCPASSAEWFEMNRDRLFGVSRPFFFPSSTYDSLKTRLRDALSAVEETNRILGLVRLVEEARKRSRLTLDIMAEVKKKSREKGNAECAYAAWTME